MNTTLKTSQIDIRSLRHVVELAKHQNFHRAADALFITQPALTKSIRNLERMLQVPLFDRLPHGVTPTAYCDVILSHAGKIFIALEEISHKLSNISNFQQGSLRVGSGPHIASTILPRAVIKLTEKHPNIDIQITTETWIVLTKMLREGAIHLFISDSEELENQTDLDITKLPTTDSIMVCRTKHPLAKAQEVTPKDLLEYPLATPSIPKRFTSWLMKSTPKGIKPQDYCKQVLRLACDDHAVLQKIIQSTNYLTAGPEALFSEELQKKELIKLKPKGFESLSKSLPGIVTLKNRTLPPSSKVFIDLLRDSYLSSLT